MAGRPGGMTPDTRRAAAAAGSAAQVSTGSAIRVLLAADIDEQRTTPLGLLRQAVRYPTEVLQAAGAAPVTPGPLRRASLP